MCNHYVGSNIGIGEYWLSAITFILTSVIGIGQNFHIGASLVLIYCCFRVFKKQIGETSHIADEVVMAT